MKYVLARHTQGATWYIKDILHDEYIQTKNVSEALELSENEAKLHVINQHPLMNLKAIPRSTER